MSRQQAQVDFNIYSVLWLAGMAALLVHALVSAGKLKRKLATAILLRDNIYESEFVDSPFVFGVVKPNIYLPMHMDEGTAAYVIAHECAHLARRGCGDSRRFVRDGRCDGRRDCDGSCGNEGCGNRRCREQCCGGGRDGG